MQVSVSDDSFSQVFANSKAPFPQMHSKPFAIITSIKMPFSQKEAVFVANSAHVIQDGPAHINVRFQFGHF
jgi:hypothetical protein